MSRAREKQTRNVTLVDFVKAKRRENCRACKLPVDIRGQIGRPASEKKISREQQIEWVTLVTGVTLTMEEFNAHVNGRHDAS